MRYLLDKEHSFYDLLSLFGKDYPWLMELESTEQDAIWHAEGNVAIHTDMVMNEVYKRIKTDPDLMKQDDDYKVSLILGAFFHDIGKTVTTKEVFKQGRVCIGAPGHEETGLNYLYYPIMEDKRLTPYVTNILQIVGYHHIPKILIIKEQSFWHFLNYRRKFDPILLHHFAVCDIKGRYCDDEQTQLDYLELFKLQMDEYGLWNTYSDFADPIRDEPLFQNYDNKTYQFLCQKAAHHLEQGDIVMPQEIIPKYYDFIHNGFSTVHILCGLSGSGKSTYAKGTLMTENTKLISLDDIRLSFSKNLGSRKYEGQVLQIATQALKESLANKQDVIYDATNLRKDFRDKITTHVINYNGFYQVHFIKTPVSECVKLDKKRTFTVGDSVIEKQSRKFQHPFY
jgi:predicted kinase